MIAATCAALLASLALTSPVGAARSGELPRICSEEETGARQWGADLTRLVSDGIVSLDSRELTVRGEAAQWRLWDHADPAFSTSFHAMSWLVPGLRQGAPVVDILLERDAANVQWLAQTFEAARASKMRGIVLVIQADPGFDLPETEEVDESLAPNVSGYRNFIEQIVKQTEKFDGQVMLVHGDTHFFKMDKPLYSPTRVLPNLVRVQTFGSPLLHWVKVSVDTQSDGVFIVQPVIVKQP
jgi:hypothetical protein